MKLTYGTKIMFLTVVILSGSFLAHGQDILSAPAARSACGAGNIKFNVSLDQSQQEPLKSTSAKAVVYILQDFPANHSLSHFTTRIGVDGAWIGANKDRSYSGFTIDPGVHHFCVSGQWSEPTSSIALHHLDAKIGETYYFAVRFSYFGSGGGIIRQVD
jgi:hypothetical protein